MFGERPEACPVAVLRLPKAALSPPACRLLCSYVGTETQGLANRGERPAEAQRKAPPAELPSRLVLTSCVAGITTRAYYFNACPLAS